MINKGDVMNSISKTILLSAVSLFVDNGNLTYASEQIPLSVPKSGIQTLHTHHTYLRHTLQRLDLSSRLFDDLMISGEEQKVAKVCFITDAGNCSGDKFGNLETPEGGSGGGEIPDDHGTPEELCEDVGYSLTGDCPALQTPHEKCPYDSSYYDKCVCQSDLVSCPSPKVGVGTSCDGKYQSCCTPLSDESGCQYGTTTSSDGCGGTRTVCKACTPLTNETNCRYGYVLGSDGCGGTRNVCKNCTPLSNETNCQYGTTTEDDGCGGTRTVCKDCTPLSNETNCQYGTTTEDDGCGGTRTVCKDCTPLSNETNCQYGTTTEDDGCGGTRTVCKDCTPTMKEDKFCGSHQYLGATDDGCGKQIYVCRSRNEGDLETHCSLKSSSLIIGKVVAKLINYIDGHNWGEREYVLFEKNYTSYSACKAETEQEAAKYKATYVCSQNCTAELGYANICNDYPTMWKAVYQLTYNNAVVFKGRVDSWGIGVGTQAECQRRLKEAWGDLM